MLYPMKGGGQLEGQTKSGGAVEGWRPHKEPLRQSRSHLVSEIVNFSTCFCVRGCALFLQIFGAAIEDLQHWCSGCLDCI